MFFFCEKAHRFFRYCKIFWKNDKNILDMIVILYYSENKILVKTNQRKFKLSKQIDVYGTDRWKIRFLYRLQESFFKT